MLRRKITKGILTLQDADEIRMYELRGYNPPNIEEGAVWAEELTNPATGLSVCTVMTIKSNNKTSHCPPVYTEVLDYSATYKIEEKDQ